MKYLLVVLNLYVTLFFFQMNVKLGSTITQTPSQSLRVSLVFYDHYVILSAAFRIVLSPIYVNFYLYYKENKTRLLLLLDSSFFLYKGDPTPLVHAPSRCETAFFGCYCKAQEFDPQIRQSHQVPGRNHQAVSIYGSNGGGQIPSRPNCLCLCQSNHGESISTAS